MRRGTTPKIPLHVPFETDELELCYVTLRQEQGCKVHILEKSIEELELEEKVIYLPLTQEETMGFIATGEQDVEMQIAVKFNDGTVDRSDVKRTSFKRILKEAVI